MELQMVHVLAQASGTASGGGGDMTRMFMFIGIMILALWFIVLRPQKKEQQKREALISGLSKGDKVVSAGGIHGVVTNAGDKETVEVEVAKNIKLTFNRSSIAVINPKKGAAEDKNEKK